MKRKMEVSELIFKIISYVLLIAFALMCVYPFIYAISSSFSSAEAIKTGSVILLPIGAHVQAYKHVLLDNMFWVSYANTLFVALLGTVWCLVYTILGAYALSKKRLMGRHGFNFFLVFTMWFSAGIVPQYLNYQATGDILASIAGQAYGNIDQKWLIIIAMGMNATNVILLRNTFEGVPSEIEEAARIDGATEMQVLFNVYIPMSKATIATVALFFGISRWNGYFWSMKMMPDQTYSWPVQVKIRDFIDTYSGLVEVPKTDSPDAWQTVSSVDYSKASIMSVVYAMVICGVIPILAIYPFIQKYFAKGVNMGGVKE
ncbi:MAG: carbohydrate ABC transporter permease [Clostridiales bacterium]|nr:carbohydrate ABC transporter permease [Clostridiales bacterium]